MHLMWRWQVILSDSFQTKEWCRNRSKNLEISEHLTTSGYLISKVICDLGQTPEIRPVVSTSWRDFPFLFYDIQYVSKCWKKLFYLLNLVLCLCKPSLCLLSFTFKTRIVLFDIIHTFFYIHSSHSVRHGSSREMIRPQPINLSFGLCFCEEIDKLQLVYNIHFGNMAAVSPITQSLMGNCRAKT